MPKIKITHLDPDRSEALQITPIDAHGRVIGAPKILHPGQSMHIEANDLHGQIIAPITTDHVCTQ